MAETEIKNARKQGRHLALLIAGPLVLALAGGWLYLTSGRNVSTDNAYLKTDKVSISAEISGKALEVNIDDNVHVTAGQVLVKIDPEPFQIAVQQAEAALDNTRTGIETLRARYREQQAQVKNTEETLTFQEREYQRFKGLLSNNAVATAQFDEAAHNRNAAIQARNAARESLEAVTAQLGGNADIAIEDHPSYKQALAQLDKARLDLSRTEIKAPIDGIVSNVDLKPGETIIAQLPLFSIVDEKKIWVEANFKETDLTYVRAGQPATITVDTYPGRKWNAHVESITPATGAEFSILPAQNSSGNWVKVVQRIMVKLQFDDYKGDPPLSAGMSAEVSIDTGRNRFQRWSETRHPAPAQ